MTSTARGKGGRAWATGVLVAALALAACGGGGDGAAGDGTGGGGEAAAALTDARCREFVEAMSGLGAIEAPGGAGLDTVAQRFQAAAGNAPREIRADLRLLADAFATYAKVLASTGFDPSNPASFLNLSEADAKRIDAALEELDTEEVEKAGKRVEAYLEKHCS